MDCTTEIESHPPRPGRPPTYVSIGGNTTTVNEAADYLDITPSAVHERIRSAKRRGGSAAAVVDVTNEPKRKPAPEPFAGPSREEVIAGQSRRLREFGSIVPVEEALDTAYTAGFAAGRASR